MKHPTTPARNYLDLIPRRRENLRWQTAEDNAVTVVVPNRGLINRAAQLLYFSPESTRVNLDEYGAFLWRRMDGESSVYALSQALSERFGEAAEPLYPRLLRFLELLRRAGMIDTILP